MAESHHFDIDRGIHVAIMLRSARARPRTIREFQVPVDRTTSVAHLGTRLESADVEDVLPIPIGLITKERSEHRPPCIGDAFCQPLVSDHPLDAQILHAYRPLALVNDLMTCLVQEVLPLVGDSLVKTSDLLFRLLAIGRSLLLSR